jgi:hypothetical protein
VAERRSLANIAKASCHIAPEFALALLTGEAGAGSGPAAGIASAGLHISSGVHFHHLGLSERARRCRGPEQLKLQYPVPAGTLADDCPIKDTTLNSAHLQVVIGLTKVNLYRALSPFQNEFRTSDSRRRAARMAA